MSRSSEPWRHPASPPNELLDLRLLRRDHCSKRSGPAETGLAPHPSNGLKVPDRGWPLTSRLRYLAVSFALLACFAPARPALADSSHARVVRLSLVQGDVRFTREAHGDPLADTKAVWETAQANLPLRQGYVVATDGGRAEIEFENGAMAFLSENSVLDFYDLSLNDGARTTRLVLRQGSASFYVNPAGDDYFSVTGGDFTIEASTKTSFRMNDYDDGSNVNVLSGRLIVLHNDEKTQLAKGQSLAMKAGETAIAIDRLPEEDGFDHWVSGRIDTVSAATSVSLQYTTAGSYVPGFADLSMYGNWFACGGYGFGWQPFGAGLGWSPFSSGNWFWDQGFGWTFASFAPWGWAPYHYGGWLFDAGCGGWFYSPPVFYNNYGFGGVPGRRPPPRVNPPRPLYHASTAVFVRQNGQLGLVPLHPLDKAGKPPLNIEHGVFSTQNSEKLSAPLPAAGSSEKWQTVKSPSRTALKSGLVASTAPERVSRTLVQNTAGSRVLSLGSGSSIAYDPHEHRFVNTNSAASSARKESAEAAGNNSSVVTEKNPSEAGKNNVTDRDAAKPPATRAAVTPPHSVPNPPPSPHASSAGGYRGGAEYSGGSSRASAPAPSPAPHVSAPSGGGGGKPH